MDYPLCLAPNGPCLATRSTRSTILETLQVARELYVKNNFIYVCLMILI